MAYPIILDMRGRATAVIGGGRVARRKVEGLLAQGAVVSLTAPALEPALAELVRDKTLTWHRRDFESADLDGAVLAFAATDDPAVNLQVAEAARQRGVPVNVVETPENGDFSLPASLRRGELLISVSTGGASPLLAARVRDGLAEEFDEAWAEYVALLAGVRKAVLARGGGPEDNKELFKAVLAADLLEPLRAGDRAELEARLQAACGLSLAQMEES